LSRHKVAAPVWRLKQGVGADGSAGTGVFPGGL
jgi:hypothetical protein